MDVCSYSRVSDPEQAEKDLSIPAQRKYIRSYAASHGYKIVQEFSDEGISAYGPAEKRKGFIDMISFCKKNKIKYILVHKLDRFSRNRTESVIFKSLLKAEGVLVKSVVEDYDPETPEGFLFEGIIEVINQFYSMNLSRETLKGMKEAVERGQHVGGRAPYGYRYEVRLEGTQRRSRLVLGPEDEVTVVRKMFKMATEEGLGNRVIANQLNMEKIDAPLAHGWSRSTVSNILSNPAYTGDLVWRKRQVYDRNRRRITPVDERIVFEGAHAQLIPRELFELRQERAKRRSFEKKESPEGPVTFLLARIMRCGHCGGGFSGRSHKYTSRDGDPRRSFAYYCNGYLMKGPAICEPFPVDMKWADGVVIDALRSHVCAPKALKELEQKVKSEIEARRAELGMDPQLLARRMAEADRSIAYYYKAIGEGLDLAICREHIDRLSAKKAKLEAEAELAASEDYHDRALENTVSGLRTFAKGFSENFEKLPVRLQREVMVHFVEKVVIVDQKTMEVHLRVPDGSGTTRLIEEIESGKSGGGKKGTVAGKFSLPGRHLQGSQPGLEPGAADGTRGRTKRPDYIRLRASVTTNATIGSATAAIIT